MPCSVSRIVFLLALSAASISVGAQSVKELDADSGYKDLKLEADFDSIGTQASFEGAHKNGVRLYDLYNPDYLRFGDVKLRMVTVETFKNKIMSVMLEPFTADKQAVLKILEAKYGAAKVTPTMYTWSTDKNTLVLFHETTVDAVVAWFTSRRLKTEAEAAASAGID